MVKSSIAGWTDHPYKPSLVPFALAGKTHRNSAGPHAAVERHHVQKIGWLMIILAYSAIAALSGNANAAGGHLMELQGSKQGSFKGSSPKRPPTNGNGVPNTIPYDRKPH